MPPELSQSVPAHRRRGHSIARATAALGAVLLAACIASEWRGVAWWTAVHGSQPHQDFALLARGELRIGTRGTAGFFTRAIPTAGLRIEAPSRMLLNPPERVWMAWWYTRPQTGVFILPVTPIAATVLAVGLYPLILGRRAPHECAACGYDLTGAPAGRCPECGGMPE